MPVSCLESLLKRLVEGRALLRPIGDWHVDLASPPVGQVDHQARSRRDTRHREYVMQDGALLQPVPRLTQCMSKRPA